jgi:transcriptional regulator with XRE-family HTH domain
LSSFADVGVLATSAVAIIERRCNDGQNVFQAQVQISRLVKGQSFGQHFYAPGGQVHHEGDFVGTGLHHDGLQCVEFDGRFHGPACLYPPPPEGLTGFEGVGGINKTCQRRHCIAMSRIIARPPPTSTHLAAAIRSGQELTSVHTGKGELMINRTTRLLDKAIRKHRLSSDYKLALVMGVSASSLGSYRAGRTLPDTRVIAKICYLTDDDSALIAVEIEAERAKSPEARDIWLEVAKRLQSGFVAVPLMVFIAMFCIALLSMPAWANVALASFLLRPLCILCKVNLVLFPLLSSCLAKICKVVVYVPNLATSRPVLPTR